MRNYRMIVEQTKEYKKRMKYQPNTDSFSETEFDSLYYAINVPYPYGWLMGYGTPPDRHLDIILVSDNDYELGAVVSVRIIGVFIRNDGDNKLLAVLPAREEADYWELPENEKETLRKIYPGKYKGEGWFGLATAEKVIREFKAH